ncbi:hypothetical protein ABB37_09894 [Leptomonas pyrrhocoris]|uniref:Uncharacterized protein n=1 Tax=Leptomonas pyrrhocoris TaxID=157538 RepID=A0A0M9FPN7_LEPPY|nr:hypothetical protein ABB37_09894 [Leptomonas pyrrhocoris]KPA73457.1 hypothetical protein ABB37_09894 [Leptomonas pyrrhocoris]|eukprot:XP_015651896.1 hypothetical protein ABB37_09894 [Leptomonas pyrrhocoris]
MQLQGHIEDFDASLSCDSTGDAHTALGRLQMDGIAQIVSFMGEQSTTCSIHTLSAVCPQMRLDRETLRSHRDDEMDCRGVVVRDSQLMYEITATGKSVTPLKIAHALWWAAQCELPLGVTVDNERSDVLTLFEERVRDRVEELYINVHTKAACVQDPASACDGQCGMFLDALSAFPHVMKLSINCSGTYGDSRAVVDVNRALRVAAQMPISEMEVSFLTKLTNFSALSGSQHLQRLTATYCEIESVADLESCPMLTDLDVSDNKHLPSVSDLAGAPRLKTLVAKDCDIRNLDGLGNFPYLCNLDVSGNESLEDLHGLAGAESLEKLVAKQC